MYANYQDMKNFIANRWEFKGSSVMGRSVNSGNYEVSSYGTCILVIGKNRKVKMFDNRGYSVTTSRLQNIIARLYGYPTKRDGKVYVH